jgi:integrating conjugative element protein (TIGR03761 family)
LQALRAGGPGTGRRAAALSLGENLNVQPVKLPLFVNAQLGFAAVYLLADYDDIARKLILAHHTALIDRSTLERWLNEGAHALRSLFSLAQQYRYSGCTRDDFAAKNAAARARWRSSASCRRTCSKARAARSLRHRSRRGLQQRGDSLPQPHPALAQPTWRTTTTTMPARTKA